MDKHQEDRTQTGPSWNDAQEYLRELAKTHSCAATVEMCLLPDNHGRPAYGLWVRVVATWAGRNHSRVEKAKGHRWPCVDHKTMPSLLLKLAHDLDWALTMGELEAEGQAFF